jgi:peptidoglycan/LPS O-acetylase OafA/YrhL
VTRLEPLDGLRAVAVLIVMVSHAGLGHIVPGGFGVTIFFFLSGYLITTLMVAEWDKGGRIDLGAFYLRRSVRILPPMWIAIIVAMLLSGIGLGRPLHAPGLVWDILFLSNYAVSLGGSSGIAIPLWSLAIEEHFYLLFPVLFIAIRRLGGTVMVAKVCVLLCIVVLLVRFAQLAYGTPLEQIYYWSHTRVDSILFGCILATWNNPAREGPVHIGPGMGWALAGGAMILFTFVLRDPIFRETWRYSIQGIGLLLIFNYTLRTTGLAARLLTGKYLRFVADHSYFLYLIHLPLLKAATYLPLPGIARTIAAFALSFLLAVLVRQWVEQPLLRWRKAYHARLNVPLAARPKGLE